MKNNIKFLIKKIYFDIEKLIVHALSYSSPPSYSGVAIMKLDAIGDYILFRNFLTEIKNSPQFAGKKFTLIGNKAWQEIAETFDSKVIDEFIWLDRKELMLKSFRFNSLLRLTLSKYEYLISAVSSRELTVLDSLINVIYAKHKIGSVGDTINTNLQELNYSNSFYTQLIPARKEIIFEFERNREFFESLLNSTIMLKPNLQPINTSLGELYSKPFIILFVGASKIERCWSIDSYLELAKWIHSEYRHQVIFCGGSNELALSDAVIDLKYVIDLIGKTTLSELIDLLSRAEFIVSNETFVPHLCVALDKLVFVISNGNHFGRFTPYPKNLSVKYFPIYPEVIEVNLNNYQLLVNKYGVGSTLDINQIQFNQVCNRINSVIVKHS